MREVSSSRNGWQTKGAVALEFAVAFPLLLLFLVGITEYGRLASNISWLSQAGYLATKSSAERAPELVNSFMPTAFENLFSAQNDSKRGFDNKTLSPNNGYSASDSTIRFDVVSSIQPIFKILPLSAHVQIVASHLGPKNNLIPESMKDFAGPINSCSYNCQGVKTCPGVVNPNPCRSYTVPPSPPLPITNDGSGCFLAGTSILLSDGSQRPIEEIEVGDEVMAFDEASAEFKPGRVLETFVKEKSHYLLINGLLKVTENHPVYSAGQWRAIGSLKVGDEILSISGQAVAINSIEAIQEEVSVYNFHVEKFHSYIAEGFVVHNKSAFSSAE